LSEKPTAAFIMSLIGGIFILIIGIAISALPILGITLGAMTRPFTTMTDHVSLNIIPFVVFMGVLGVIYGVVIIISAVMLYNQPNNHQTWGAVILIFSVLSWFGAAGGLFIGFLLSLIGGILGITWKPAALPKLSYPSPRTGTPLINYCPQCGNSIQSGAKYCMHCGAKLES